MIPVDVEGETRKIGKPLNWDEEQAGKCGALSVCDTQGSGGFPMMISKWQPDENDLKTLMDGGAVYLAVYGQTHPVVSIYTGGEDENRPSS